MAATSENGNSATSLVGRRLEGKVAIITGGAAGIGAATAKLFHQHGAKVAIIDIEDDLGRSICQSLGPDNAIYVHCDVSKEADVQNAVDLTIKAFGKLDIMFNNAAILETFHPDIADVDTPTFERVLSVNVTGVFLGTKHAARAMGRGGSIINNGSVGSVIGGCAPHGYIASKHAVIGLTRNSAAELGQRGIRVNCVSPFGLASSLVTGLFGREGEAVGDWISGMAPLKGAVLRAEDIADAAMFLASDESKYVSGHNLVVDGGFTTINNSFGLFNK